MVKHVPAFLTILYDNRFFDLLEKINQATAIAAHYLEAEFRASNHEIVERVLGTAGETVHNGERIAVAVIKAPELLDEVRRGAGRLSGEIKTLAEKPGELIEKMRGFTAQIRAGIAPDSGADRLDALNVKIRRFRNASLPLSGGPRAITAQSILIRAELTAALVQAVSENDLLLYPQGEKIAGDVQDELARLQDAAGTVDPSGELEERFRAIRIDFNRAIRQKQEERETTEVETVSPVPALVALYDRTGSLEYEPDLSARNRIDHPGFLEPETKYTVVRS